MNRELERMWPDAERRDLALDRVLARIWRGVTPLTETKSSVPSIHALRNRPDLPTRCYIVAQAILRGCGSWLTLTGHMFMCI